jgi:hypothetical protein
MGIFKASTNKKVYLDGIETGQLKSADKPKMTTYRAASICRRIWYNEYIRNLLPKPFYLSFVESYDTSRYFYQKRSTKIELRSSGLPTIVVFCLIQDKDYDDEYYQESPIYLTDGYEWARPVIENFLENAEALINMKEKIKTEAEKENAIKTSDAYKLLFSQYSLSSGGMKL